MALRLSKTRKRGPIVEQKIRQRLTSLEQEKQKLNVLLQGMTWQLEQIGQAQKMKKKCLFAIAY